MENNKLLHPETFSNIELRNILESLCIIIPENLTRCDLIEFFKKVALPLPQRKLQPWKSDLCPQGLPKNNEDVMLTSYRSECSLCSCPRNKREIKWYLYDEPAKKMKLNSAHMEMGDDVDQVKSQLNNIQIGIPRELFLEQATVHPLTFHRISESIDENISILPREKVTGKKRSLYQVRLNECKRSKISKFNID